MSTSKCSMNIKKLWSLTLCNTRSLREREHTRESDIYGFAKVCTELPHYHDTVLRMINYYLLRLAKD